MKDGTYFAKLVPDDVVTSETKNGNPQVELKFNVTHILEGKDWSAIPNVERTLFWSLVGGAWEYTQKKLTAVGFQGDFESPAFVGVAVDTGVSLLLSHEDYNGKPKERWDLASWGGGGKSKPASKDVTRQFNSRWKSEVGSGPTAAKAPPPPSQATPPVSDEMPPATEPGETVPGSEIPY